MVDFRRCMTALAMLALFAGLATAQVNPLGQLTCVANTSSQPALRVEGFTETTGDVTLTCTGGNTVNPGGAVPLVNVTVFYSAAVTSRLFSTGPNLSEALLLIDEPGSGLTGAGAALPQLLCTTPTTGCQAIAGTGNVALTPAGTQAPNVYQGITTGNSVTFFGVPVLPPSTTGSRVFRITNVRIDATTVGAGASGGTQVSASFQISPATSLLLTQSTVNVGVVSSSLTTGTSSGTPTSFQQCTSATRSPTNTITFTENFGTAFKTRIVATDNTQFAGQGIAKIFGVTGFASTGTATTATALGTNQNTPGAFSNSESNFVFPIGANFAGLADYGTRLKATFSNVPTNATLFVSVTNVTNAAQEASVPPCAAGTLCPANVAGGNLGNFGTTGFAQLVQSETVNDGTASGFFPLIAGTDNAAGPVRIVAVPIVNGTGSAVWEVLNTNPNALETFRFGVYLTFVASTATGSPAAGTSTVALSYAPTATSRGALTGTIPRFSPSGPNSGTAVNLFAVNICRTILLYPYVTNQQGFDTGITVANTSNDSPVFTTGAQSGKCTFNFYGGTTLAPNTPPPAFTTPNAIVAGQVFADGLSNPLIAPGFQGYIIAVCNFQYAHGFAFINNPSQINNVAMGYLALVIPDAGTGSRLAGPDCSGIAGCPTNGESASH